MESPGEFWGQVLRSTYEVKPLKSESVWIESQVSLSRLTRSL